MIPLMQVSVDTSFLANINWQLFNLIIGIFGIFGLILTLFFLWQTPEWNAKLRNLFSKKHYGLLHVAGRGRRITTHVINFNEPTAEVQGAAFTLPTEVFTETGLPSITYSYRDGVEPVYVPLEKDLQTRARDPNVLEAVFQIQKARAEAGALIKIVDLLKILSIVTVIMVLVTGVIAFVGMNNTNSILDALHRASIVIK